MRVVRLPALLALLTISLFAAPYKLEKTVTVAGAYFFSPAAATDTMAAFGYMGKIRPTPEEVEKERKRIRAIIRGGIEREYGSWENYEKEMQKAGKAAAEHAKAHESDWAKELMPPSLIEQAVPTLLKGALMWVMAHPEKQTRPFGNVGETGVVLVDEKDEAHKVPIGIDQPVVSLSFSPDGRYLAVLSDMSVEDEAGRAHIAGRISVVDTKRRKVLHEWVLANAADEVRFSPDGRYLAFLLQDPKKWSRKALRLIDTATWNIEPRIFPFQSIRSSGARFGKEYRRAHFRFCCDGKRVALVTPKGIECRSVESGETLYKTPFGADEFAVARTRPWVFDMFGGLYDCEAKRRILEIPGHRGGLSRYEQVAFVDHDRAVIALNTMLPMERIDLATGKVTRASERTKTKEGLFFLTPDERHFVTFHSLPRGGYATYGPLRRQRVGLNLFETRSLRYLGSLEPPGHDTFIDAAATDKRIVAGGFATLYLYERR